MTERSVADKFAEFEQLTRNIAEQVSFLARQKKFIEKLRADGQDLTEAERHLASIEETLWRLIDRRKGLLGKKE